MEGVEPHCHTGNFKNECKKTKQKQICGFGCCPYETGNFNQRQCSKHARTGRAESVLSKASRACRSVSNHALFVEEVDGNAGKTKMKPVRNSFGSLAIIGGLIASLNFVHGQTNAKAIQAASAENMAVMLPAVESTTPLPAESVPPCATFYSALHPNWPPLPDNINLVPAWNLGDGVWLLDDLDHPPAQKHTMAGNHDGHGRADARRRQR